MGLNVGNIGSGLSSVFTAMDANKDGNISKTEFNDALSAAINKKTTVATTGAPANTSSADIDALLAALLGMQEGHHRHHAVTGASPQLGNASAEASEPSISNLV